MKKYITIFIFIVSPNIFACNAIQDLSNFLSTSKDFVIDDCSDRMYFDDESCDCSKNMVSKYKGIEKTKYSLDSFNNKLIEKAKISLLAIANDISTLNEDSFSDVTIPECTMQRLDVKSLCGGNSSHIPKEQINKISKLLSQVKNEILIRDSKESELHSRLDSGLLKRSSLKKNSCQSDIKDTLISKISLNSGYAAIKEIQERVKGFDGDTLEEIQKQISELGPSLIVHNPKLRLLLKDDGRFFKLLKTKNIDQILKEKILDSQLTQNLKNRCNSTFNSLEKLLCKPIDLPPSNVEETRDILTHNMKESPTSTDLAKSNLVIFNSCKLQNNNTPSEFDAINKILNESIPSRALKKAITFNDAVDTEHKQKTTAIEDMICAHMPPPLKKLTKAIGEECKGDIPSFKCRYLKATLAVLEPTEEEIKHIKKLATARLQKQGITDPVELEEKVAIEVAAKKEEFVKFEMTERKTENSKLMDHFLYGDKKVQEKSQLAANSNTPLDSNGDIINPALEPNNPITKQLMSKSVVKSSASTLDLNTPKAQRSVLNRKQQVKKNMNNFYDEIDRRLSKYTNKRNQSAGSTADTKAMIEDLKKSLEPPFEVADDNDEEIDYRDEQYADLPFVRDNGMGNYVHNTYMGPPQNKFSNSSLASSSSSSESKRAKDYNKALNFANEFKRKNKFAGGGRGPASVGSIGSGGAAPIAISNLDSSVGSIGGGIPTLEINEGIDNLTEAIADSEFSNSDIILDDLKVLIKTKNKFYIKPKGKDFKFLIKKENGKFVITNILGNQLGSEKMAKMIEKFLSQENIETLLASNQEESIYQKFTGEI